VARNEAADSRKRFFTFSRRENFNSYKTNIINSDMAFPSQQIGGSILSISDKINTTP
jgi:hypothetical protein